MKKRGHVVFRQKIGEQRPELKPITVVFDVVNIDGKNYFEYECPGCNAKIRLPLDDIADTIIDYIKPPDRSSRF